MLLKIIRLPRRVMGALAAGCMVLTGAAVAAQETRHAPAVVVSIAPIHSLAAMAMDGIAPPKLLLPSGASPHGYALKPSDARDLSRADLVVWVGPALESFLVKPFATLVPQDKQLALMDSPGVKKRPVRSGGTWQSESGDAHSGHENQDHGTHAAAGSDPHIWLDPMNGIGIIEAVAERLARIDPRNAGRYQANARSAAARLRRLDAALAVGLAPVRRVPYIVLHDAYGYFEARYRLNAVGSIVVAADRRPGIRRLQEIRARLKSTGAACVFAEPQFSPAIAATVVEDTGARVSVLDPLGVDLAAGPNLYENLLNRLADSLHKCLSQALPGNSP